MSSSGPHTVLPVRAQRWRMTRASAGCCVRACAQRGAWPRDAALGVCGGNTSRPRGARAARVRRATAAGAALADTRIRSIPPLTQHFCACVLTPARCRDALADGRWARAPAAGAAKRRPMSSANAALMAAAASGSATQALDALEQGADINFKDGVRLLGRVGAARPRWCRAKPAGRLPPPGSRFLRLCLGACASSPRRQSRGANVVLAPVAVARDIPWSLAAHHHMRMAQSVVRAAVLTAAPSSAPLLLLQLGRSPLYAAACNGHAECLQLLLERGADVQTGVRRAALRATRTLLRHHCAICHCALLGSAWLPLAGCNALAAGCREASVCAALVRRCAHCCLACIRAERRFAAASGGI
jgi:hypothetical protein